ncbi:MAG: terminase small subunit [Hominisplanchenecus sp.]
MKTTGKNPAQSYEEMTETMEEARENGLALSKGNSIYKQQAGEYKKGELSTLLQAKTQELVEVATREKVSLADSEEVKRRTIVYLRACEETSTFPSALGLARSLGYSDRALRNWRNKQPLSETAQWLEMFNDLCADVLNQSALDNNANSIVAIFLNKAMYGFRETNELVLTPNTSQLEEEAAYSAEEIRKRYMINTDTE